MNAVTWTHWCEQNAVLIRRQKPGLDVRLGVFLCSPTKTITFTDLTKIQRKQLNRICALLKLDHHRDTVRIKIQLGSKKMRAETQLTVTKPENWTSEI